MSAHSLPDVLWHRWPTHARGQRAARERRRTLTATVLFWIAAAVLPSVLGLPAPWRAFGAGLIVPGAGILYAVPPACHAFSTAMVIGHAALIWVEITALAWALRKFKAGAAVGWLAATSVLGVACVHWPTAVVISGHVAATLGVLAACLWAFGLRLIGRADFTTLPAIIILSATAGAALVSTHHGSHTPGPLVWMPWAALALALGGLGAMLLRSTLRYRSDLRKGTRRQQHLDTVLSSSGSVRTDNRPLPTDSRLPTVVEATTDQLRLLRYLMAVSMQPASDWSGFDPEGAGPVQQYRYQINALGWALSTYGYAHAPALSGPLVDAQVQLFDRMQQKAVWGYWYWENLLGNWDFIKRRADPIDVPQNIMFSAYTDLQLGLFRQATGDLRYNRNDALVFDWSPRQRFEFSHQRVNEIVVRNFREDLCLWPCEPAPFGRGRTRGFVFPYCNAVAIAAVAVGDVLEGTDHSSHILPRFLESLNDEFVTADGDLVTWITSGLGIATQVMKGSTVTASVAGLIASLSPEFAWRTWEILRHEWLDSGFYRVANSAGAELPDWGTGARTNAGSLAAAMLLAREVGDSHWYNELWQTSLEQLHFQTEPDQPGLFRFADASVHSNGMLGFAGFGRLHTLTDMLSKPRPAEWDTGPRLVDVPHPAALVAKAVTDGMALDMVIVPGSGAQRIVLQIDRLRPHALYWVHGAQDTSFQSDEAGRARLVVDLGRRTPVIVWPA